MKRKCRIVITDEVNCHIVNLTNDHTGYFYEEYGKFAPNYIWNPKYKLGSWDGKIRYFHKTGKTYVNLLEDIIPRLIGLGYEIDIDDQRESPAVFPDDIDDTFFSKRGVVNPDNGEPWIIRDYQVEMVNAMIKSGGGVGILGTGGGKTSICAALALLYEEAADFKSIIIVPDKNLTEQTVEEYQFFNVDVGQYSGDKKDINHKHVVSTWQALKNNPKLIQEFDMIIVDECHGLKGQVLTKLLNEYGKNIAYRFGVTGTLPKAETDAMSVKIAVGTVQFTKQAHELIEEDYLATLNIDIYPLESNFHDKYKEYKEDFQISATAPKMYTYKQFKTNFFPDYTSEKQYNQNDPDRLNWIAKHIEKKKDAKKGNVLCLVDGVKFGRKLAGMVDGAIFISGSDKMKARKEVYDLFKENDNLVVIATVQIASTGLNIKRIYNMMFIDLGKSFIRVVQTIGRGLRKAVDKDHVDVSDICSDLKYGRKHMLERIKVYKEAKYKFNKYPIDLSTNYTVYE